MAASNPGLSSFRRFFTAPSVIDVFVNAGVGPVELALRLHHDAHREIVPETATETPLTIVENALRVIFARGQFILLRNVQHWLDDEGSPEEPLTTLLRIAAGFPEAVRRPIVLTSTRRITYSSEFAPYVLSIRVQGLADGHVASLISLWHELMEGVPMDHADAARLAPQIHGHPVAAKLAANLATSFGVDDLLDYPHELARILHE